MYPWFPSGQALFFSPLWRSSSLAPGPGAARLVREGALSKKSALSPQRSSGVEPGPFDSDAKSRSAGSAPPAGRAAPAARFSPCSRSFSAGSGGRSVARRDKIGRYFPLRSPRPFPFSCSPPLFSRCKKPARQVFSDRPGWLFVLFHLLRAPPCGDAVWINAAADSAPRNRRRSPRRWAAPTRRGSCPGCACRRYVRPPCCPPPGAGRPTAPARRWR